MYFNILTFNFILTIVYCKNLFLIQLNSKNYINNLNIFFEHFNYKLLLNHIKKHLQL